MGAVTTTKDDDGNLFLVKMSRAFGTADEDVQNHLLNQALLAFPGYTTQDGLDRENVVNYGKKAVAMLEGIQPTDEIEGMLVYDVGLQRNIKIRELRTK